MKIVKLFSVILLLTALGASLLNADITFNRQTDWSASAAGADPNGHGTQWDTDTLSWSYYTMAVAPTAPTVYPGTEYSPADLVKMKFRTNKGAFYDPYETTNTHIAYEYETQGLSDRLYVYWNAVNMQTGGTIAPFDSLAPYGKQQWCVAVFTNTLGSTVIVDLSGASEIQTGAAGALDGAKVEIAKINSAFDSKTPLWSFEYPSASPALSGAWNTFTTAKVFGDFMLESTLQGITLEAGESLAFGIRASNLEDGVNGVTGQYLQTMWVDEEVNLTVSSATALNLTVATDPAGNEASVTGAGQYSIGDTATIEAADFNDCANGAVYKFDHWTGDVADASSAVTTVDISSDTVVTAVYAATAECGDACHPIPVGSADGNCEVNIDDIKLVAANWLSSNLD
ncbi:MAG: hypothetical protein ACIAQZ_11950 [Sedimentisphaeraceae bacterium JB056]